jgi:hypothetical protein
MLYDKEQRTVPRVLKLAMQASVARQIPGAAKTSMALIVARPVGSSKRALERIRHQRKILIHFDTLAEDCGAVVVDAPTCADPSWTLYMDAYAFCCQSGDVGIQGEQCQPKPLTFSAALYAATVGFFQALI